MENSEQNSRLTDLLRRVGDLSRQGHFAEALATAQERFEVSEVTFGIEAEETLSSMLSLGDLLTRNGKHQEASAIFEKARDTASSLKDPNSSVVSYALTGFATNELAQGHKEEACTASRAALQVIEHSASSLNTDTMSELFSNLIDVFEKLNAQEDLAALYAAIARVSKGLDNEKLASFISKVIAAARWFAAHDDIALTSDLAKQALNFLQTQGYATLEENSDLHEFLGLASLEAGDFGAAADALAKALEMKEKLHGENCKENIPTRVSLGDAWLNQGKVAEAKTELCAAIKIIRDAGEVGKTTEEARCLSILGELYLFERDYAEAKKHFQASLVLYERLKPAALVDIAHLCHNIGVIALNNNSADAVSWLERAAKLRVEALGSDDFDYAQTLWALGKSYELQGRIDDARKMYRTSIDIQELYLEESDPALMDAKLLLESLNEEVPENPSLPQTNATPVETPSTFPSLEPLPRAKASKDPFPGNMAGHLMLAALLALENQKPDIAVKILREGVSILGMQRSDREKDLEASLSLLIALLEDMRPGEV